MATPYVRLGEHEAMIGARGSVIGASLLARNNEKCRKGTDSLKYDSMLSNSQICASTEKSTPPHTIAITEPITFYIKQRKKSPRSFNKDR